MSSAYMVTASKSFFVFGGICALWYPEESELSSSFCKMADNINRVLKY